jgi:hypothetical protein
VSVNILKLESDHAELSGVSASERQLAILDRFSGRGLKRHGKKVGRDSSLQEEIFRDRADGGI